MDFWGDVARNIGNFFGFNKDDEEKRRQVVAPPQNTLRSQAVRPSVTSMGTINIPSGSNQVDTAAIERKRREDELKRIQEQEAARRAKQTRQPSQPITTLPTINIPGTKPSPINIKAGPKLSVRQPQEFAGLTSEDAQTATRLKSEGKVYQPFVNAARSSKSLQDRSNYESSFPGIVLNTLGEAGKMIAGTATDVATRVTETVEQANAAKDRFIDSIDPFMSQAQRDFNIAQDSRKFKTYQDARKAVDQFFFSGQTNNRGETFTQETDREASNISQGRATPGEVFSAVVKSLDLAGFIPLAKVAGAGRSINTVQQLARESADDVIKTVESQAGKKLTPQEKQIVETELEAQLQARQTQPPEASTQNPTGTPVVPEAPVAQADAPKALSFDTIQRIANTDVGAAIAILRQSGRRFEPQLEVSIANELALAKTPEMVRDVLTKYGIEVAESPAEAAARQAAQGQVIQDQTATRLAEAPQELVIPEPVPTAPQASNAAVASPDIAQNEVVPRNTNDLVSFEGAPDKAQVESYKRMIQAGQPIDPILVIKDRAGKYGIEDGKHRYEAYKQLGIEEVPTVDVTPQVGKTPADELATLQSIPRAERTAEQNARLDSIIISGFADVRKQMKNDKNFYEEFIINEADKPTRSADLALEIITKVEDGVPLKRALDESTTPSKPYTQADLEADLKTARAENVSDRVEDMKRTIRELEKTSGQKGLFKKVMGVVSENNMNEADAFEYLRGAFKAMRGEAPSPTTAVREKLARGEELTPEETATLQREMGIPQEQGALKRATTAPGDRKTTPNTPVNAALTMTDEGQVKPLTKFGEAGANTAQIQRALIEEGDAIGQNGVRFMERVFSQIENKVRKIAQAGGRVVAEEIDKLRVYRQESRAAANQAINTRQNYIDETFRGASKEDQDAMKFILENFSNTKKTAPLRGTKAMEMAEAMQPLLKEMLDTINPVLKANKIKEIGRVEDYFPRMQQLNTMKSISADIKGLLVSSSENISQSVDRAPTRGFAKERTLEEGAGKQLSPYEALSTYTRQATDLTYMAPVVQKNRALIAAVEGAESANPVAKQNVTALLNEILTQINGGMRPQSVTASIARRFTNMVSQSQIAGSVNTLLTNPITAAWGFVDAVNNSNLFTGAGRSMAALYRAGQRLGSLRRKDITKLAEIDGMQSSYLIESAGIRTPRKNVGRRVTDAGYQFSNLGELPIRAGFLEQRYFDIRKAEPDLPKEEALRKAERDITYYAGNRAAGERSQFTASGKTIPVLASQYQVEQIANVGALIDNMMNPKNTAFRKFQTAIAALGVAYGYNELVGAATQGAVQPMPDLIGAGVDAMEQVDRTEKDRAANGEPALTDAEKYTMFTTNLVSRFVSNLPLGRTAIAVPAGVASLGLDKQTMREYGLNPSDTNPLQTLPGLGAATNIVGTAADMIRPDGGKDPIEGAFDIGTKLVPFGGQINRTVKGAMDFVQGESRYPGEDGEPGDLKYTIENDLTTPQGVRNLVTMVLNGRVANPGAREWIDSGFQTQMKRDIKNGNVSPADVANMNDKTYSEYREATLSQFQNTLSDEEKKQWKAIKGGLLERNLNNGTLTQEQVDDLTVRNNRYMYEKGLVDEINTGYDREFLNGQSEAVKQFAVLRAIEGKERFESAKTAPESEAVLAEAYTEENLWPTLSPEQIKNSNGLAVEWVEYQKKIADNPNSPGDQFNAQRNFWKKAVSTAYDEKVQETYSMGVSRILALYEGRKINDTSYKISKNELDNMVKLDNQLLAAGLIDSPKFTNKNREKYGYGPAPVSQLDGTGYAPDASGGSGKGSKVTSSDISKLLTNFGGSSEQGFKPVKVSSSAPEVSLQRFRNRGGKSGKSSIKIKL